MLYFCAMENKNYDLVLIGAGIMSATLAALIRELHPSLKILLVEKLSEPALESSGSLNNAGTGHAGFCELNYTPMVNDTIDIHKAIEVNESYKKSKQFWAYLVSKGYIDNSFITRVPHISFVTGKENCFFLEKRWEALKSHHMFDDMLFTTDIEIIAKWAPLLIQGRDPKIPVAATKMNRGTDVDFGNLTKQLIKHVGQSCDIRFNTFVKDIKRVGNIWQVILNDDSIITTSKVFDGAGGNAIHLLQQAKIPEIQGYGGFPVSGEWLVCDNPNVVNRHNSKVYGIPPVGGPPMSAPHMDIRKINGKKMILFGPYAGFSMKFLKTGKWTDLLKSINFTNIGPMIKAGIFNLELVKYLIKEVFKPRRSRLKILREYFPNANPNDWKKAVGGQRVQIIRIKDGKAIIEFGTEVVGSQDGTMVGLLGASPGASTSVSIMLDVINKMYKNELEKNISDIIPSVENKLQDDKEFFKKIESETSKILGLV